MKLASEPRFRLTRGLGARLTFLRVSDSLKHNPLDPQRKKSLLPFGPKSVLASTKKALDHYTEHWGSVERARGV